MYLGMANILFGVAFLLIVVVCFMVMMDFNFIKNEETMLEDIFGDAYLQYQKKVRKWI
jgi:protein-S-isoprenylcysteine O-methyltransferase Ste14